MAADFGSDVIKMNKKLAMESMYISEKEIQILYADTDMMGVIYHANYLKWFELGRTQLIIDIGYNYLDMERLGYYAPVYKVEITYKRAIRYGEKAVVRTWVDENNGLRTVYGYHILNGKGEICVEGTSTHIVVRKEDFKPVQFKKVFPEWFQKYEEIKKK
ncbi:acyl-CoA thioester hydrolase [Desulforamulus aeronauticus DSM 10349]|uniref:Acyl-CoA thioester hydrolase n=2 Tax=Desulforamulus aeronauticus TaxID=53343 RepID=A0A1M6QTF8_9FIRM|nr:acyl-CoA thioester hydrolase [Desulforamulus aeronauticus DSM 10349]